MILASTAGALLAGEGAARLAVHSGDFLHATMIGDPVLGNRVKPNTTGHDALGFRNPEVPARAGIVAIGDSMTYGDSAPRNGSWPYQLGVLLGKPVYNMGLGGFGPLEYLYLAQHQARNLHPRTLLVGFYFGNDLIDAYYAVYRTPHWASWRAEGRGGDRSEFESEIERSAEAEERRALSGLRHWLSRHSVIYSMARTTLLQLAPARWIVGLGGGRLAAPPAPDREMAWADPAAASVRTTFTPQLRLLALDPGLIGVREGLRLTKRAFTTLKSDADAHGVRLLVILIPTKERVYCRYLMDSGGHMPDALVRLCDAEERIKKDLVHSLETAAIAHVDVTRALEEQVRKHVRIYPRGSDGHPAASGYGVVARAVYDGLRRLH